MAAATAVQVLAQDPARHVPVVLRVPFAAGERQQVGRGPGVATHADAANRHAVDFALEVGHRILSASAGRVVWQKSDTAGPTGVWTDNNEVAVQMPNGVDVVVYLHLRQGGAAVSVGDEVLPGDLIGFSGNTGNSDSPHLHIDVRKGHRLGPSVPWHFDVLPADEPPQQGQSIRSANVPIRPRLAAWFTFERCLRLARALDEVDLLVAAHGKLAQQKLPDDAGNALLREVGEAVRARIHEQWQTAAKDAGQAIEKAPDDAARALAALRALRTFGDSEAARAARAVIDGLDRAVVQTAERELARRERDAAALRSAFDLERKLISDGVELPLPPRLLQRLRSAYDRATRGWPQERAALVEAHLRALGPRDG